VLDFGKEDQQVIPNEKNKQKEEKPEEDEFEFLNVSELQEQ